MSYSNYNLNNRISNIIYDLKHLPTPVSVPNGTSFSDYLFWNSSTSTYQSGNTKIHIGSNAGLTTQADNCVAIGQNAGQITQGVGTSLIGNSIAIGQNAGNNNQSSNSIAIGLNSGQTNQGSTGRFDRNQVYNCIAIGQNAGQNNQSYNSIAIGFNAGNDSQSIGNIAIGVSAGASNQGQGAIALSYQAGNINQGKFCIAMSQGSGQTSQGQFAIAIGANSGNANQGQYSIAIGSSAGKTNQNANSIILNASGLEVDSANIGLFVNPIRNFGNAMTNVLNYNPSTSEVSYSLGIISSLGNSLSALNTKTWANGVLVNIMPNRRYKLDITINTNYAPLLGATGSPRPFCGMNCALYTSTRNYSTTYGDPVSTNQYLISSCNPVDALNNPTLIPASFMYTDYFDLSGDSSTTANISFYPYVSNSTALNIHYSFTLTPIS